MPPKKSSCLNCEAEMTPHHQCQIQEDSDMPVNVYESEVVQAAKVESVEVATQCVKCCVCAALGRETSLVLCGSVCPSCGVTATAS